MPDHPPRLARHLYIGERTVAFTAVTEKRARLFTDGQIVDPMVDRLEQAAAKFGCMVPIYCFMPDHVHIMFAGLREDSDTLQAMTRFKLLTGLWFERKKMVGWQYSFYDHLVMGSRDWRSHANYISQNPVRWGLVSDPFHYPFSGSVGGDLQDVILRWN